MYECVCDGCYLTFNALSFRPFLPMALHSLFVFFPRSSFFFPLNLICFRALFTGDTGTRRLTCLPGVRLPLIKVIDFLTFALEFLLFSSDSLYILFSVSFCVSRDRTLFLFDIIDAMRCRVYVPYIL